MTDCVVRARINNQIKAKAALLFEHMGLTISDGIRIFLYQSVAEKRIPFAINKPNATTFKALKEVKHGKHLRKTSIQQLAKEWADACSK